jgi:hypothetical protein
MPALREIFLLVIAANLVMERQWLGQNAPEMRTRYRVCGLATLYGLHARSVRAGAFPLLRGFLEKLESTRGPVAL